MDETRSTGRLWLAILAVGFGFMVAHSDPTLLTIDAWDGGIYEIDEHAGLIAAGSLSTKVAILSMGLLGLYFSVCREGWHRDWHALIVLASLALLGWCILSIAWSTDPGLSLRRVVSLLCVCLLCVGITRQLTPREVVHFVVALTSLWIGVGIVAELAVGKLRPWETGYRFSGMVHPNTQGIYAALLLLGCVAEMSLTPRYRNLWRSLAMAAIFVLIIAKSRTAALALIAAVALLCVLRPSQKRIVGALVAGAGLCVVLAVSQFMGNSNDLFESSMTMGREDATGGLTGRVPLWNELTYFVGEHPILGHGYGAFWNIDRTEYISGVLYWTVPSAHSAYFEAMLDLGLVGAGLLVLLLGMGMVRAVRLYQQWGTPAYGFLLALFTFLVISSFMESELVQATVICLFAGCAVLQVASSGLVEPEPPKRPVAEPWVGILSSSSGAF